MNKENIKEIVNLLKKNKYEDVFSAIVIFEGVVPHLNENTEITEEHLIKLQKLYNRFLEDDYITGLLNDDLKEKIDYLDDEEDE